MKLLLSSLAILAVFAILAGPALAVDIEDTAEDVKDKVKEGAKDVKDVVKDQKESIADLPMMPHAWAIPVAVVLGIIIGFFVGRRSSKKKEQK